MRCHITRAEVRRTATQDVASICRRRVSVCSLETSLIHRPSDASSTHHELRKRRSEADPELVPDRCRLYSMPVTRSSPDYLTRPLLVLQIVSKLLHRSSTWYR
ncbi:hypothetical protein KC19_3G177000 [Ceratodon purpureus]|uniref:Uncharacterized protein n=1 Tax=Ceratodon purpureus TaxID=3225 RepID=A0A8T0IM91_CERPU|nr:hypothetical protein KC19_3G177000 [Ceratodon purpureus]